MLGEERPSQAGDPARRRLVPKAEAGRTAPASSDATRPASVEEKTPVARETSRETVGFASAASSRRHGRLRARPMSRAEIEFDPTVAAGRPPSRRRADEIADVSFAQASDSRRAVADVGVKHVRVGSNVDILAELERLRKNATSLSPASKPTRRAASGISVDDLLANSLNHRKEVSRVYELQVPRQRARRRRAGHRHALRFNGSQQPARSARRRRFSIPLESRRTSRSSCSR